MFTGFSKVVTQKNQKGLGMFSTKHSHLRNARHFSRPKHARPIGTKRCKTGPEMSPSSVAVRATIKGIKTGKIGSDAARQLREKETWRKMKTCGALWWGALSAFLFELAALQLPTSCNENIVPLPPSPRRTAINKLMQLLSIKPGPGWSRVVYVVYGARARVLLCVVFCVSGPRPVGEPTLSVLNRSINHNHPVWILGCVGVRRAGNYKAG